MGAAALMAQALRGSSRVALCQPVAEWVGVSGEDRRSGVRAMAVPGLAAWLPEQTCGWEDGDFNFSNVLQSPLGVQRAGQDWVAEA